MLAGPPARAAGSAAASKLCSSRRAFVTCRDAVEIPLWEASPFWSQAVCVGLVHSSAGLDKGSHRFRHAHPSIPPSWPPKTNPNRQAADTSACRQSAANELAGVATQATFVLVPCALSLDGRPCVCAGSSPLPTSSSTDPNLARPRLNQVELSSFLVNWPQHPPLGDAGLEVRPPSNDSSESTILNLPPRPTHRHASTRRATATEFKRSHIVSW